MMFFEHYIFTPLGRIIFKDDKDLIDCIIYMSMNNTFKGVNIYNVGVDDAISVKEIADIICDVLGYNDVIYRFCLKK